MPGQHGPSHSSRLALPKMHPIAATPRSHSHVALAFLIVCTTAASLLPCTAAQSTPTSTSDPIPISTPTPTPPAPTSSLLSTTATAAATPTPTSTTTSTSPSSPQAPSPSSSSPQVNYGNLIVLTVVLLIYLGVYCSKPLFRVWLKLARAVTSAGTVRTTQRELALQAASPRMLDPIRHGGGGRRAGVDDQGRIMVVRDPELGVVVVEGGETLPRYASLGGGLAAAAADGDVGAAAPMPVVQRVTADEEVDLDTLQGQGVTPPPSWAEHAEHARGPVPASSVAMSVADSASPASVTAPLTGNSDPVSETRSLADDQEEQLRHVEVPSGQSVPSVVVEASGNEVADQADEIAGQSSSSLPSSGP